MTVLARAYREDGFKTRLPAPEQPTPATSDDKKEQP
jgi:hypothetical protein